MNRLLAFLSLIGFTLSLLVHISALLGIDAAAKIPHHGYLHLGLFVVFIPFVFLSRKAFGPTPNQEKVFEHFPRWVIALGYVIFAYTIINFLIFMFASEWGGPAMRDGKFFLESHGRVLREITASEYQNFRANIARGFSGHWILFYYIPLAFFMLRRNPQPAGDHRDESVPLK